MNYRFENTHHNDKFMRCDRDAFQITDSEKHSTLCPVLKSTAPSDPISTAILARYLLRQGISFDEATLNKEILNDLLANALTKDPESLRALCRELIVQGYAPTDEPLKHEDAVVFSPIEIEPSVQGQLPGKTWAFIWSLDRECDNLDWLRGAQISVNGKLYRVQNIENALEQPTIGDKLTLLCSTIK